MNRRSLLLGLSAVAAPFVIRTPGLLMPVRKLSASEIDPADINGIIAELPDGATWRADPNIQYWAKGSMRVHWKTGLDIDLNGAQVVVEDHDVLLSVRYCMDCAVRNGRVTSESFLRSPPSLDLGMPPVSFNAGWYHVACS